MPTDSDNRMGWIRNLEVLASGCQQYTVEYELALECQIPGLLDYADGKIICAPMSTEESRDGCGGEGGYRRVRLSLRLTDNSSTDAWVYVAKQPKDDPALRPYTWYKRFLVEGAREHRSLRSSVSATASMRSSSAM
jgi:hypothetical protein